MQWRLFLTNCPKSFLMSPGVEVETKISPKQEVLTRHYIPFFTKFLVVPSMAAVTHPPKSSEELIFPKLINAAETVGRSVNFNNTARRRNFTILPKVAINNQCKSITGIVF